MYLKNNSWFILKKVFPTWRRLDSVIILILESMSFWQIKRKILVILYLNRKYYLACQKLKKKNCSWIWFGLKLMQVITKLYWHFAKLDVSAPWSQIMKIHVHSFYILYPHHYNQCFVFFQHTFWKSLMWFVNVLKFLLRFTVSTYLRVVCNQEWVMMT